MPRQAIGMPWPWIVKRTFARPTRHGHLRPRLARDHEPHPHCAEVVSRLATIDLTRRWLPREDTSPAQNAEAVTDNLRRDGALQLITSVTALGPHRTSSARQTLHPCPQCGAVPGVVLLEPVEVRDEFGSGGAEELLGFGELGGAVRLLSEHERMPAEDRVERSAFPDQPTRRLYRSEEHTSELQSPA